MSAWYSISGSVRVRRCPEVDAIAAKIREHCDRDFAVSLVPRDAEIDEFSIEGAGEFPLGGVLVLDELLESLGPYALEAAVLTGEYENEPCELVVAPTAEAGANGSEPSPPEPDQADAPGADRSGPSVLGDPAARAG